MWCFACKYRIGWNLCNWSPDQPRLWPIFEISVSFLYVDKTFSHTNIATMQGSSVPASIIYVSVRVSEREQPFPGKVNDCTGFIDLHMFAVYRMYLHSFPIFHCHCNWISITKKTKLAYLQRKKLIRWARLCCRYLHDVGVLIWRAVQGGTQYTSVHHSCSRQIRVAA